MVKCFRSAAAFLVCFALVITSLPFYVSADNSGFGQIRIYYKLKDSNGNWGSEQSAIITDNSCLEFYYNNQTIPLQITRFLIRNDSIDQSARIYFQFDINFGGQIPVSGTFPQASYSSLSFTTNGGVTAYSFATTDRSFFEYQTYPGSSYPVTISSDTSRTFFGRCDQSGYITFNNPVNITFKKNDSPSSYVSVFFRHLVIGLDSSSYMANMETYLADISANLSSFLSDFNSFSSSLLPIAQHDSSNIDDIHDWAEEEHQFVSEAWSSGAGDYYDSHAPDEDFYSDLDSISGIGAFSSLWNFGIFSQFNSFFSDWFSQGNSDNINGTSSRSDPVPAYVDFMDLQDDIDFWKEATDYVGND